MPDHALPEVHAIDVGYQDLPGAANVYLLRASEGPILIEAGTQATLPRVERALRERGVDPASILHVFVTHIHLDHAGAAGAFAQRGATIHVHPFGARHLIDPSKLIASSRRVHGSGYERWYGDPLPAPEARVIAEPHGATIDLGSLRVQAIETPGHARHHHAWLIHRADDARAHDSELASEPAPGGVLFTGDAAATFVPGSRFVAIPTPPPEYDLGAWRASIDRMKRVRPAALWLTHGGEVRDPIDHLETVERRLVAEDEWLREAIATGDSDEAILDRYRPWLHGQADAAGVPEAARDIFIGRTWMAMNLAGARRAIETSK